MEYQYLVGRLQEALAGDARVSMLDIRVMAVGGRIHLTGDVPTQARRDAVDLVAAEVLGGVPVRNELKVMELGGVGAPERIDD